jgi:hypothetical protein
MRSERRELSRLTESRCERPGTAAMGDEHDRHPRAVVV